MGRPFAVSRAVAETRGALIYTAKQGQLIAMPKTSLAHYEVPDAQDHFAGEIFEHIADEYGSTRSIEAVFNYYSNIGEYGLQDDMDPRAFVQFVNDARILAEDFTMFDAEDITRKLVEDGYTRLPLPAFYIALAKIAFYKYRLAPRDSAETLIEDHILPLEGEAVSYMRNHGARLAQCPHPEDLRKTMNHSEMMHRVYLFYTEQGKPMFWEDFRLFLQDFEIAPAQLTLEQAAHLFHQHPDRMLNFEDFFGPTLQSIVQMISGAPGYGAYAGNEQLWFSWLESLRSEGPMLEAMRWYDDTYGKDAPHNRKKHDEDHVGLKREDPTRKDQPVRPAHEYTKYEKKAAGGNKKGARLDAHSANPWSESILPGPDRLRNQGHNPFVDELKERQRSMKKSEPINKSKSHTLRGPSPYHVEPQQWDADYADHLLTQTCAAHRVDLQLLFDTYGQRDADSGRGVIIGDNLHQLVWDAGLIGQGHRLGVTHSVNEFFEKCCGNAFRDNVRISFERFRIMLIRVAEWMATMRDHAHAQKMIDFAMTDLVRDYLVPLVHAKFWQEYSSQTHHPRQVRDY